MAENMMVNVIAFHEEKTIFREGGNVVKKSPRGDCNPNEKISLKEQPF